MVHHFTDFTEFNNGHLRKPPNDFRRLQAESRQFSGYGADLRVGGIWTTKGMIPKDFSGKSQKWIEMGDINLPIGDLYIAGCPTLFLLI